jgi:hypothetical protein
VNSDLGTINPFLTTDLFRVPDNVPKHLIRRRKK